MVTAGHHGNGPRGADGASSTHASASGAGAGGHSLEGASLGASQAPPSVAAAQAKRKDAEDDQEPLALLVVHAAMHMLFLPQFTCDFYEDASIAPSAGGTAAVNGEGAAAAAAHTARQQGAKHVEAALTGDGKLDTGHTILIDDRFRIAGQTTIQQDTQDLSGQFDQFDVIAFGKARGDRHGARIIIDNGIQQAIEQTNGIGRIGGRGNGQPPTGLREKKVDWGVPLEPTPASIVWAPGVGVTAT